MNIRESYKLYKKTSKEPVGISTYTKLTGLYIKFLILKVLEGEEVTLPARLGTLHIRGKQQKVKFDEDGKMTGLSPNWKDTKKLWDSCPECKEKKQLIYNTNEHTGGIRYKYLWSKARVLISNKTLYSLKMTRDNKRAVFKKIMEGQEYI